jgi:uncharacterized protein YkwD
VPSPGIRHLGLTLAVATAVAAFTPNLAGAATNGLGATAVLETQIAARVNAVRGWHGLRPLRLSPGLTAAARRHSRDMAVQGYFEHDSRNGTPFWKRIERSYPARGFARWEVGENIAWSSAGATAVDVVRQWMGSAAHRSNLLSATWREFGLGAFRVSRAGGAYGGRPVTIVTLDFGLRTR